MLPIFQIQIFINLLAGYSVWLWRFTLSLPSAEQEAPHIAAPHGMTRSECIQFWYFLVVFMSDNRRIKHLCFLRLLHTATKV